MLQFTAVMLCHVWQILSTLYQLDLLMFETNFALNGELYRKEGMELIDRIKIYTTK